ncbi:MAG: DUF5723 family protein [Bacteroidia bacterium]
MQLAIGNYGKVHSIYLNPSLPGYSKFKWQVNLAGFWVNANNNYLSLHMPYSVYKIPNRIPPNYKTESGNPQFDKFWLREHLNGRPKHISVSSDVYGPSASVSIKSWSFGFFSQASAGIRVSKLPENLAHAIWYEFDSAQGAFSQFNATQNSGQSFMNAFNISGNSRINLGINVAKSFELDWQRQVLFGINLKKVWGLPGFYFKSDAISVNSQFQDSLIFSPGKFQLISYGEEMGNGWGSDIGISYIFNKKSFKRNGNYSKTRTEYFAKLGFSILDIGRIKYQDATYREVSLNETTGISTNTSNFNSIKQSDNYQLIADSFLRQFSNFSQYQSNINIGLPTRIMLSGDFQFRKNVFVSSIISQSLRKRSSEHNRYQNFLMVSPRYESRFFEISVPAMLEYDYRSLRIGTSLRIGPVYIGSNNLASFIYTRGFRDVDLFAGIAFGNFNAKSFKKQTKQKRKKHSTQKQNCGIF